MNFTTNSNDYPMSSNDFLGWDFLNTKTAFVTCSTVYGQVKFLETNEKTYDPLASRREMTLLKVAQNQKFITSENIAQTDHTLTQKQPPPYVYYLLHKK